jgi:predicted N-acetyltransferase YhbS
MNVRPLDPADLTAVAHVHADCFARQRESLAWVMSTSNAYPRFRYFIAESDGSIVGYIVWGEKSGFRDEVVLELEQLAVQSAFRSQGIGRALIRVALLNVQEDSAAASVTRKSGAGYNAS